MHNDEGRAPGADSASDPTELRPGHTGDSDSGRSAVRFTPGSVLAGRYRVVAPLGRGGMGEVWRAEDMKLGQQVALKFLPRDLANDRTRLQRLYEEVKLGRQVSHPNVCRMYDVAEWEGHHFISMEYIDGEDLASLLRRIGKLPHDKSLDIARDLCAGLAAAHSLGIIHRDLKPANVMIDGRGNARITDFGLAALAADLEQRREIAGTPAYMAPEQIEGHEVTQRTDLYGIGLILYEMFTGKRLFDGATFADTAARRRATSSQSFTRETGDVDPAIQRVIARCLEDEPSRRPASIHSVIAALPGGDPLQAAIDAGETPSPEMLAAAGSSGELAPAIAWALLVLTIVMLLATAALSPRVRLYGQVDLPFDATELSFRARQILAGAGMTDRPGDTAFEFGVDREYRRWIRELRADGEAPTRDVERTLSPVIFGYRESPSPMKTTAALRVSAFESDPALEVAGMGQVILEPDGRLRRIVMVPPEATPVSSAVPDWDPFFEAAGIEVARATEIDPLWRPPVGSDRRFAWSLAVEGLDEPLRIEAASLGGRPAWFEVITPWKRPIQPWFMHRTALERVGEAVVLSLVFTSLIVGAVLAIRNFRRGRGDRRGALRVACAMALISLAEGFLMNDHYRDAGLEASVLFELMAWSLFGGTIVGLWYLALEPYLRRRWPTTLISWSRLLQRRWLDPLVGRDILIGVLAGSAVSLAHALSMAAPSWLGWTQPIPWDSMFLELTAWKYNLGYFAANLGSGLIFGMLWMIVLLVLHLVLRSRGAAIAAVFVLLAVTQQYENHPLLSWAMQLTSAGAITLLMVRRGLVALVMLLFSVKMFQNFPTTLDPAVWYFDRSLLALAILVGLAAFGFVRALGAQALFAEPVLED